MVKVYQKCTCTTQAVALSAGKLLGISAVWIPVFFVLTQETQYQKGESKVCCGRAVLSYLINHLLVAMSPSAPWFKQSYSIQY